MKTNSIKTLFFCLSLVVSLCCSAATRFSPTHQPLGSIAPIVLSNTDLSSGDVTAYRPWFENGSWQGDIVEYSVSSTGAVTTSVNFTQTSPINTGNPPANWSALVTFGENEASYPGCDPDIPANDCYWDDERKIITANNGTQTAFRWSEDALGATTMADLDQVAVDASATSSNILDWVRGDRSNEYPAVAALRSRASILGDIIHSNPVYVGAPNSSLTDHGYATWATSKVNRSPRVYVGSNDGMLHAFDAADGNEIYAYIPSMVTGGLDRLVARPYVHSYFVDGKITVADAYFDDAWHTILVGSLGAGGAGIYALDITDPNMLDEAATSGSDVKLMWEKSNVGDNDLGDSFARPVIAKLNDDNWYVVVGNGYNSVNGVAVLYLISLDNPSTIIKISTGSGNAASPNGLSSPTLVDVNFDGKTDYAYAGDIDGNLWKFDLSSSLTDSWARAYGSTPLHTGIGTQPITMAPEILAHPSEGFLLFFATGRLFNDADLADTSVQAMYGIHDDGDTPPLSQSLVTLNRDEKNFTLDDISEQTWVFSTDPGSIDWSTNHGWVGPFDAGYRVLEGIQARGGRVKVTVVEPVARINWITESTSLDGGPYETPIYDLTADGILDNNDLVDGDIDGTTDVPMGWQRNAGVMSQVTIARVRQGIDVMILNYLEPPVSEPCTGNCENGFQGGHIDVDTWHTDNDFAGKSTQHDHEYDKKTARVYVDAFDTNVPLPNGAVAPRKEVNNHVEINAAGSGIASDEKFVVLIANADFSPGSTFKIGNKMWNVAEYQREIHIALRDWDATDSDNEPLDSDGDSLIFTWGEIELAGGTISHNFNDVAILSGGLHPSQTGCVKDSAYGKKDGKDPQTYDPSTGVGRWRNGALTTQLVAASHFTSNSALSDVVIQQPVDLVEIVQLEGGQVQMTKDFDGNDEFIGGLIAKSGAEHLWESTLFWHFGKLYDLVFKGKPCYGEPDWEAAVAFEQRNDAFANALEVLEIDNLEDELEEHEHCKNVKEKDGGCKDYYKLLEKLLALQDSYQNSGDGTVDGGEGDIPVIVGGGAESQGVTVGPGFNYGRQTWTTVVPD
jgi:PilY1 beta-propeller domain